MDLIDLKFPYPWLWVIEMHLHYVDRPKEGCICLGSLDNSSSIGPILALLICGDNNINTIDTGIAYWNGWISLGGPIDS